MHYNNRMPHYEEKVVTPPKSVHTEIKDGKTIYVEGPRKNPYQGVSSESLKLSSRISAGTFENHEGSPNKLEKAQGSDIAVAQIEAAEREFEIAKEENFRKAAKKKMDEAYNKHIQETLEN